MNRLTLQGNWNLIKGKLKQKYAQLTEQDLTYIEGKEDELLGHLQKRTGARREELEEFLWNDYRDGDRASNSPPTINKGTPC